MGSEFFFFAIDRWIAKKNKNSLSNSPCLFGLARCICQINPPRPPLASGLSGWSRAYSRRARGPDAASTAADVAAAAADVAAAAADAAAWRALLRPFICGREVEGRALSVADMPAGVEPVQRGGREGRMLISLGNSENEKTEGKKLHLFPSIGPSTLSFFFPPLSLSLFPRRLSEPCAASSPRWASTRSRPSRRAASSSRPRSSSATAGPTTRAPSSSQAAPTSSPSRGC